MGDDFGVEVCAIVEEAVICVGLEGGDVEVVV